MLASPSRIQAWAFRTAGGSAFFAPLPGPEPLAHRLPQTWRRWGLVVPEDRLAGFATALGEVMKLPAYWVARHACADKRAGDADRWALPYLDEDQVVHVAGPCDVDSTSRFAIALPHVRGLRIRLSAYLRA